MRLGPQPPVTAPPGLKVGDRLLLDHDRFRWTVEAMDEDYAVVTRQQEFTPRGTRCYTILDWRQGIRGPLNSIGQGYGDGTYSREQCEALLADLHDTSGIPGEVSHRNRVPLVVTRMDSS